MSELDFLPSIKVHPFPKLRTLVNSQQIPFARRAAVNCPVCMALDDFYSIQKHSIFSVHFCPGNMPPEVEHKGIFGTQIHQISCAGIRESHFHVACRVCDSIHFLALPEKF